VALILTFALVVGNVLNGAFAGIKITKSEIYTSLFIAVAMFLMVWQSFEDRDVINRVSTKSLN
jgi:hypothetical protein